MFYKIPKQTTFLVTTIHLEITKMKKSIYGFWPTQRLDMFMFFILVAVFCFGFGLIQLLRRLSFKFGLIMIYLVAYIFGR